MTASIAKKTSIGKLKRQEIAMNYTNYQESYFVVSRVIMYNLCLLFVTLFFSVIPASFCRRDFFLSSRLLSVISTSFCHPHFFLSSRRRRDLRDFKFHDAQLQCGKRRIVVTP